ncbi:LysR substrate-binding domain-containing protein [Shewanella sp. 1_MG-2023]|uniref:LysR substrate-binding domain-containing protein n=1 Tax=Shewanella electrodiphila TaxID=934143 RepID=A0ABT0KPL3_9GAMM|nr:MULTISPECIES: LysR family transcriptional regulator [Shewanella]MCC4832412.1 LysR family transcriptional regulator [Shewanella sp. 10N.7]MCL1045783.1 LysR substrate-binding domain-containing protein [Shewanella electrodiphila]MDO6610812.1 LysR substrate-binding domain-containing protein [Shewanella sp. 7_MG-2023]MDO6770337.1 LysR substrate-binding domain-containing protein [Shewanella sp. 2_MG-2023]MDO6793478.1 LysR substrate-binding domain-containing protein [Shewanella sp. 1_MG-2023]
MDQLRALKYFVKVVELGSFTQAAKTFSVPASSLSRRVADLEKSLGATLLKRSTRAVSLTEIGTEYYQQVSSLLNQLEQSNEAVRSYQTEPMGTLRISAMVGIGREVLIPLMDEFSRLYPKVILDIELSDELSSVGRDDVDIAIRGGYAPNDRVVAIRLMDNQFIPAATEQYLQQMGTPHHPSELSQHKGLYYRSPNGRVPWLSFIDGQWQDVSAPAAAISNAGEWLIEKAKQGDGIVMMPRWVLSPFLHRGELQELDFEPPLSASQSADFGVYLIYQKQRYHVPKVKAAVDFLVARIKHATWG